MVFGEADTRAKLIDPVSGKMDSHRNSLHEKVATVTGKELEKLQPAGS